jgi:UrcA family protein
MRFLLVERRATSLEQEFIPALRREAIPLHKLHRLASQKGRRDMKPIIAIAALTVASALVVPTVSQAQETNSVRVSYADLNLGSEPGQNVLQRRIAGAARTVCVIEDSREIALRSATNACRSDAVASAQPAYEAAVAAARRGTVTVIGAAALVVTRS